MENQLLSEGLNLLNFLSDDEQKKVFPLFKIYLDEIALFNKTLKLTSASESQRSNIIVHHIFDSLAALPQIALLIENASHNESAPLVADIGSGGGFPGIPLAICASVMPNLQQTRWTLIDRSQKKCAFLQNCAALMKLSNISVQNIALEKAPENCFAVCVFRAFRPLTAPLLAELFRKTAQGGFLAAYKARLCAIQKEMIALETENMLWRVQKISVPFLDTHERHLVIISKRERDVS
jgi:16S rRNA (guanine527-N7)-methyltransferase